jgi:3-isopropylmalate/(R)-2-methylmalate dehydratase small subunit
MTESNPRILKVEGRAIPVRGDDIDTDRIIPARFLRCVTFDGLGEHAFEDDRKQLGGKHPFDREEFQGAKILVVGDNFGCGSSREHAPQSLQRWGIDGIVGVSFAEIFFGNCMALGLPCFTLPAAQIASVQDAIEADPTTTLAMDVDLRELSVGDQVFEATLPDGVREALTSGRWDSLSLLLDGPEKIEEVAGALPYVSRWPFV